MTDWLGYASPADTSSWPKKGQSLPLDSAPPFTVTHRSQEGRKLARTGIIHTPHGQIRTPAFIPVGTKATVKATTPEMVVAAGGQAVLANAYHLYLQPGSQIVDQAGGLGNFMNWSGPTFTDSGGFQVLSMGAGFKKVLSDEFASPAGGEQTREAQERAQQEAIMASRAVVDEDGVTFRSHIDGSPHRFTPEFSITVQHQLGADIIFAFDELTSLSHPRSYQVESLERTEKWARRSLAEHISQTTNRPGKPYQQLWGVIQGADYQDLRQSTARTLASMEVEGHQFDGFGIGGALRKEQLGQIVSWVTPLLPEHKGRHLLGISEPYDLFEAIDAGIDTFDCVNPSRVARNAAIYSPSGRYNVTGARYRSDFSPLVEGCGCYTCRNYSRAYVRHLFKAKEMLASTLATIHNEWFTIRLVDAIRQAVEDDRLLEFRADVLTRFYGRKL